MSDGEVKYLLNPYKIWSAGEGVPVIEDFGVDLLACETKAWSRIGDGCKGAIVNLKGRGDNICIFLLELDPGVKSAPQKHLYEEIFYVLSGHGSVTVEAKDGRRHSFEWGPKSMFCLPLNARYQIFNGSGREPARLASSNNFCLMMNIFHNEKFIFDNAGDFSDRESPAGYFAGEGDLTSIRPGRNLWETNFVPDVGEFKLMAWEDRGAGSTNMQFILADGCIGAHTSEMPVGTYKKGHRHGPGLQIFFIHGTGYSLLWYADDKEFQRIDWRHGMTFAPPDGMFHQHFCTSPTPARYLAIGFGSKRYPVLSGRSSETSRSDVSIKQGGRQIEYEDQDPRIHATWLAAIAKTGVTSQMGKYFDESKHEQVTVL